MHIGQGISYRHTCDDTHIAVLAVHGNVCFQYLQVFDGRTLCQIAEETRLRHLTVDTQVGDAVVLAIEMTAEGRDRSPFVCCQTQVDIITQDIISIGITSYHLQVAGR